MKKLLFVLSLGAFAACGSGENKENATDSTKKDSIVAPAPAVDSTKKDSAVVAPVDSTKKDSLKK
ncbi:hypothetical protein [Deminuibacter soli]|uniref:Cytochrome C551 n=1 Tax=Deminuibacter soli TaxID=2291815 RepID=A0A3E1NLI0_9BACT|nr:hypothetical protein [Deminuibacter soli]RFM28751.1 hypothetical protein DXN05_08200 [Deminuibacter soli]